MAKVVYRLVWSIESMRYSNCNLCGKLTVLLDRIPAYVRCYACLLYKDNKVESNFEENLAYVATGIYPHTFAREHKRKTKC